MTTTGNALRNLNRLRTEFPLQARMDVADMATRDAYATVLMAWLHDGIAPQPDIIHQDERDKLAALDAVVVTESGLGCYPFSALNTGIEVEFGDFHVSAMCAIDALAIPVLAQADAVIRSRCRNCDAPLLVKMNGNGLVAASSPADVCVEYRQLAEEHAHCCSDLCPGIGFLCGTCCEMTSSQDSKMSLEDAATVGHDFFYFQSRLLGL